MFIKILINKKKKKIDFFIINNWIIIERVKYYNWINLIFTTVRNKMFLVKIKG